MRVATYRAAAFVAAILCSLAFASSAAAVTSTSSVQHIVWVVMENHSLSQIKGSSSAPYINSLMNTYGSIEGTGSGTGIFAECHPSAGNYVHMTSGVAQSGVCGSDSLINQSQDNVFHQFAAGGSRSLEESMPSNCDHSNSGNYAFRHNPEVYFTDVGSGGNGDCAKYDVPLGATPDISAPFTLVTPNLCHDMHSNSCAGSSDVIKQGDDFLKSFVPALMSTTQYQAGNTVIFITWDEDNGSCSCATTPPANKVPTIIIDPYAGNHDTSTGAQGQVYRHWSMLHYVEQTFGVPQLGPSAPSLAGHFGLPVPGSTTTSAPANTAKPTISGTPVVGGTLTSSTGSWSGTPTSYTYNWQRCVVGGTCSKITGFLASNKYVVQSADVGDQIRAQVKACNSVGCTVAGSARTAAVTATAPASSTAATYPSVLHQCGRHLCDASGAQMPVFKGFDAQIVPWSVSDFDAMKMKGASMVKLVVIWPKLEPTQGTISSSYISDMDATLANLRAAGLYAQITFSFNASADIPSWLPACPVSTGSVNCMSNYIKYGKLPTQYLANRYGNPASAEYAPELFGFGINEPPPDCGSCSNNNATLVSQQSTMINWFRADAPKWMGIVMNAYGGSAPLLNQSCAAEGGKQITGDNTSETAFDSVGGNVMYDSHMYQEGATTATTNYDGRNKYGEPSSNMAKIADYTPGQYPSPKDSSGTSTSRTLLQSQEKGFVCPITNWAAAYDGGKGIPVEFGEFGWPIGSSTTSLQQGSTTQSANYAADLTAAMKTASPAAYDEWDFAKNPSDRWAAWWEGTTWQAFTGDWIGDTP